MELFLNSLDSPVLDQTLVKSLALTFTDTARQIYDFLVSPACMTTDFRRATSITRLVIAASTGLQHLPPFNAIADPMRLHLLIRRLTDGPNDFWESSDELLLKAFTAPYSRPILRADIQSVLVLLRQSEWDVTGQKLRVSRLNISPLL